MSVVATVKVYDGIVLGAESMTQLMANINGQMQWVKSYENAQKIFQIAGRPVGILTYGSGNIGRRSIESFVHEFSRTEDRNAPVNVEAIAARFFAFMQEHHAKNFGTMAINEQPTMGFLVSGYSAQEHLASEWEFILPQDQAPRRVRPQNEIGASWRGIAHPFSRVFFGIDPILEQGLLKAGFAPQQLQQLKQGSTTMVAFDGMPLQDAVGFCKFIIQTTIGWCTYALGNASCGGPIKIAVITPGRGFLWINPPTHELQGEKYD